jgi:hypothetical protein
MIKLQFLLPLLLPALGTVVVIYGWKKVGGISGAIKLIKEEFRKTESLPSRKILLSLSFVNTIIYLAFMASRREENIVFVFCALFVLVRIVFGINAKKLNFTNKADDYAMGVTFVPLLIFFVIFALVIWIKLLLELATWIISKTSG